MSCLITSVPSTTCTFILAGLSDIWVGNFEELSASTASAITMSGSAKMYKVQFEPNSANFLNELTVNGTVKSVKQSVSWQTASEGQTVSTFANQISLAKCFLLCKTKATGKKFIFGRTGSGLIASTVSLNSGQAENDSNIGLLVTVSGGATEYALEYTGSDASIPV